MLVQKLLSNAIRGQTFKIYLLQDKVLHLLLLVLFFLKVFMKEPDLLPKRLYFVGIKCCAFKWALFTPNCTGCQRPHTNCLPKDYQIPRKQKCHT